MSDSHDQAQTAEHEVHEGPIKTPKQLMVAVIASFVVPVVLIILLTNCVDQSSRTGAGSDAMTAEATLQRIQPVARVEIRDASDTSALKTGEQVYAAQCAACHATGAAGAPKFADAAAWAPRLKTGYEALLNAVLKGKGAMAAQGGGDFSDLEIARAVVHLANSAGGKFAEPAVPAPAAAASK